MIAKLLRIDWATVGRIVEPAVAAAYVEDWLAWASRSKPKPFVKLARTIEIDLPFS